MMDKAGAEEAVSVMAADGPSADGPSGEGSGVGQQSEDANSSDGARLCLAATEGDLVTVLELLSSGTPVDAAGDDGVTPLIAAAKAGRVAIAEALLAAGAAPACADKHSRTALHMAAKHGHVAVVRLLLSSGAAVGQGTDESVTALHFAAFAGQVAVVEELLSAGADLEDAAGGAGTPLIIAAGADEERLEVVLALLAAGASLGARGQEGTSAAHRAAILGHCRILQALLEAGCEVGARSDDGCTPLHFASERGMVDAVELLLRHGAPVDAVNNDAQTALHYAADYAGEHGTAAVVRALLAAGADTGLKEGRAGMTPLHLAAVQGYAPAVGELLAGGADVTARDQRGSTPLHCACTCGSVETARLLLAGGAPLGAADDQGETPIFYAAGYGWPALVEFLVQQGADPNQRSANGSHCLCMYMHRVAAQVAPGSTSDPLTVLSALLKAGVSAAASSEMFPTPLDELLVMFHDDDEFNPEPPSCAAELVRMLAGAGCQVSPRLYCHDPNHTESHMSTLEAWMMRLAQLPGAWPQQLSASALEVSRALLEAAAAEDPKACSTVLPYITATGSLELIQAVSAVCPQGLGGLGGQDSDLRTMAGAASMFCIRMEQLAAPEGGLWQEQHAGLVLHLSQVLEALLAAGCSPVRLTIDGLPCPASSLVPQTPELRMMLPAWASDASRELLPLVASGRAWAPDSHAAFPPAFRAAAKELLLINSCRGFGLAAGQELTVEGQQAIQLPAEQVLTILQLASRPVAAWVPQLRPFV